VRLKDPRAAEFLAQVLAKDDFDREWLVKALKENFTKEYESILERAALPTNNAGFVLREIRQAEVKAR
jgi:hypothetical protein